MALWLLLAAVGPSPAATPLTAHDCIEAALQHSFLLSENRHAVAADKADITKKRGTTLPYLSGLAQGYELWGNPVSPYTIVGQPEPESGTFASRSGRQLIIPKANFVPIGIQQIGVLYPLYYQGSILGLNDPPAVASAVATMNQEQLTTLISEQEVIFNVLTEYIYGISYRDRVAVQERIVDLDRKQLEIVQYQVALGLMLPYQAETARAQLKAARQILDSSRANVQAALVQLSTLMGTKDQTPELAQSKLPLIQLPPMGPLLDKVMTVHPALRVQQANVEIAHQQLLVDRAVRLPTVSLNSALSTGQDFEYFNGSTTKTRPVQFLSYLNVEIPLYDFGQRHAAINESEEKFLAAQDGVHAEEITLRESMKGAYNDILTEEEALATEQSTYVKDDQALDLSQAQRAEGQIDELALVVAQLKVLNDRVMLVADQMAELLKYAELQNLSGGTWRWLQ